MDKKVKEKWIEALRSGKHKQYAFGKQIANSMGILTVLYIEESGIPNEKLKYIPGVAVPVEVMEWSGISNYWEHHLVVSNDLDKTFFEIADLIEKEI